MSSATNQESDYKKTLLTRLLAGVKGCQSRFGSRSELATEDEESVARLCAAYEDVFSHGLQKKTALQSSNSKANFWVSLYFKNTVLLILTRTKILFLMVIFFKCIDASSFTIFRYYLILVTH